MVPSDMLAPLSFSLFSLLLICGQHADAQVQAQEPLGTFDTLGVVFGNSTAGCQQACIQLQATSPADVDSSPEVVTDRYFALQQRQLTPACVVLPESADDVARAVQVVREHHCPFAVRSGGHGNHVGVSNIQGGLVIDLGRLKSVTVSEDESVALIGPGNRWVDVYEVLEEKGLLVVGGRTATVGVGGLTLGGGISYLSRRYGWAVDNIRNYEVILANGTIANVNKDSHPDLFFALRGGGNNFGIVTRFDFETRRIGMMSGGTTTFNMEDLESRKAALGLKDQWQWTTHSFLTHAVKYLLKGLGSFGLATNSRDVIREFVALGDESQTDAGAHAFLYLSWVPSFRSFLFGITRMYTTVAGSGTPDPDPPVFRNVSSLKKLHSTNRVSNMTDFARELDSQNAVLRGELNIWRTVTLKLDADLISDVFDLFISDVHPYTTTPGALFSCNLQMLTKYEIGLFAQNGGNAFGIHPDEGPLFLFSVTFSQDAADYERFEALAEKIMSDVTSLAKERGLYHPFIYQNYAGPGQDVYAGYSEENRARLRQIQRKYDPEGVFWKLQPGYYKV